MTSPPGPDADEATLASRPRLTQQVAQRVREGAARIADIVLPPVCLVCQVRIGRHDAICPACWRDVQFIRAPLCDRLGLPLPIDTGVPQVSAAALAAPPIFDRARAVGHHAGPLRALVHALKYHDRLEPRRLLARWMVTAGADLLAEADVIVPVPLQFRRLLWRRFNQAALLANAIGRQTHLPVAPSALVRIKPTQPQVGLTEAQRAANVRAAFRVPSRSRPLVAGRRVLLIDDVITTGATANACARALKRAGAVRVDVLAVGLVDAA
jgi:ComF family protein